MIRTDRRTVSGRLSGHQKSSSAPQRRTFTTSEVAVTRAAPSPTTCVTVRQSRSSSRTLAMNATAPSTATASNPAKTSRRRRSVVTPASRPPVMVIDDECAVARRPTPGTCL